MSASGGFEVRTASWSADGDLIRAVRHQVFVLEQGVPAELDLDGRDPQCTHALAIAFPDPIGTGRMLADGHIGRMAVVRQWRGRGVGSAILEVLIAQAKERGLRKVFLHAQVQAVEFYRRHGFEAEGEVFMDAGIPHRYMYRLLTK